MVVKNHLITNSNMQSIALSDQEDNFMVSTAERTVYHFQVVSMTSNSSENKWVQTKPLQHHTHDVQTMACSSTALIFGSIDTHLVTHSLIEKNWGKEMTLLSEISLFPSTSLLFKRDSFYSFSFFITWIFGNWDLHLQQEGIGIPFHSLKCRSFTAPQEKCPDNITCSCISAYGSWMAYSTASWFFIYQLNYEHDNISLQGFSQNVSISSLCA